MVLQYMQFLTPKAVGPLCTLLRDLETPKMEEGDWKSGCQPGARGYPALVKFLSDPNPQLVCQVIDILGDIGHSSTLKHLDRLVTHPEPRVREETLQVLAKFGRKAQKLIQDFLEDAVPEVRGKASLILARTIKDEAVRPLSEIILSDDFYRRAYDEKVSFFKALGETGSREAVPILEKIAKKRNWFRKSKWRKCASVPPTRCERWRQRRSGRGPRLGRPRSCKSRRQINGKLLRSSECNKQLQFKRGQTGEPQTEEKNLGTRRNRETNPMETVASSTDAKEGTPLRLGMSNTDLSEIGNSLVKKLHVMMRVSQIYDANNVTFRRFMHENLETMNTVMEKEEKLSLKMLKGDIFLNDQRLRYSVEGFTSFKYLITQWKKKRIGGVTFKGVLDERMLREFLYAMNSLPDGRNENAASFSERMASHKIHSIEAVPLDEIEDEDSESILQKDDQKAVAKRVFFETVGTIKDVITQIKQKQYPDVRKLKRLVQTAVRLVMQDESMLLG